MKWGLIIFVGFIVLMGIVVSTNKDAQKSFEEGKQVGANIGQSKPKVDFTGKVEPSTARKGQKVVMTIEVTNQDNSKTIDGMRILFANEDFVKKGLVITNVMSGGVQDGRAFEWTNSLMQIKPGEKRDFVIVAQANVPGNYESVVTLVNPTGKTAFDDQNQELKAKLTVLP